MDAEALITQVSQLDDERMPAPVRVEIDPEPDLPRVFFPSGFYGFLGDVEGARQRLQRAAAALIEAEALYRMNRDGVDPVDLIHPEERA